jgi:DNA polymerase-3 subunit beta
MNITIPKKDLLRLVSRCVGVADKKSAMPALSNVLLTAAADGTLRVSATDMYLSVTGSCAAEVAAAGSVALPARELHERVKAMPEGPVAITVASGAQTTIKASGAARRFTVHGIPGEDFPPLPQPASDSPTRSLPVALLASLISHTHFSVSTDETRAHVNSTLLEFSPGAVRAVSTDGHRLSKIEAECENTQGSATMLISLKAIGELRRLADDATAEAGKGATAPPVAITQSGPNAFFDLAGMRFSVKLVDAQFPPYQQVIPKKSETLVRVPRASLHQTIDAVRVAASDRTGGIKLEVVPGLVRVMAECPESGNGFDEVYAECEDSAGPIGANAKYFLDVLGALGCEEVEIGLSGELDPITLRPLGDGAAAFIAVIMPMRGT